MISSALPQASLASTRIPVQALEYGPRWEEASAWQASRRATSRQSARPSRGLHEHASSIASFFAARAVPQRIDVGGRLGRAARQAMSASALERICERHAERTRR